MSAMRKGLLLAAVQIAIVLSLGGKLLYDRATRPRVWVLGNGYDPDLVIRGRYLAEKLQFPAEGFTYAEPNDKNRYAGYMNTRWAYLAVRGDQLVGEARGAGSGEWVVLKKNKDGTLTASSQAPVLVFVPDDARIAPLKAGQELWVEVTVPAKGPPRAIRIGIKQNGVLTPLRF